MSKLTYAEMLKDPRWQRKRLEILERDSFSCRACWAQDVTLHVHHIYYLRGHAPWEYPDEALTTLCANCHDPIATKANEALELLMASPECIDEMIRLLKCFSGIWDHVRFAEFIADHFGQDFLRLLESRLQNTEEV